jgi:hypothetical protein
MKELNAEIQAYNNSLEPDAKQICDLLAQSINENFPYTESKIWHRHPVWFIKGNPIVGYAKLKANVQLLFWSGQSFSTPGLEKEGTFKASQKRYNSIEEVDTDILKEWLKESVEIQWNYKDIVKNKGKLDRLN